MSSKRPFDAQKALSSRPILTTIALTSLFWFFFSSLTRSPAPHSAISGDVRAEILTIPKDHLLHDIDNATLGFESVFALNLKERKDRRDRTTLAAAALDFNVEFKEATRGVDVEDKVFPAGGLKRLPKSHIGSWRSHMDMLQYIVQHNISSALVLDDDIDFDARLRTQLKSFAKSVNTLQHHKPHTQEELKKMKGKEEGYDFEKLPMTPGQKFSPYGDDWEVLWLGHCTMALRDAEGTRRVIIKDKTVPEPQHLAKEPEDDFQSYRNHTRVVFPVTSGTCISALAVSQRGARALLNDLSLFKVESTIDDTLGQWCRGANGYRPHKCYTARPSLFDIATFAADAEVDPEALPEKEKAKHAIRQSVLINLDSLLSGSKYVVDSYPDHDAA